MRKRNKIIIIIIVVLLLLLLLWLLLSKDEEPVINIDPAVLELIDEGVVPDSDGPVDMLTQTEPLDSNELSIETVAKSFAERYGSYSSQSNFQNLRDLSPLMTNSFQVETENLIATLEVEDIYHGVTTRVLSVDVSLSEDEVEATCQVQTQREEAWVSPQNTEVTYQILSLELVKSAGEWKVDGATWE
jgi:hypothetical protein